MAVTSLHGRLAAELTSEFRHRFDALHQHAQLINRFGEAIAPLGLDAHVKPAPDGGVTLVAASQRGRDHAELLRALADQGFAVGPALRPSTQFTDGFVIWTAPVRGAGLQFTLLYYVAATAA